MWRARFVGVGSRVLERDSGASSLGACYGEGSENAERGIERFPLSCRLVIGARQPSLAGLPPRR